MGEETLTGSVTDSCQENEFATTTHMDGMKSDAPKGDQQVSI